MTFIPGITSSQSNYVDPIVGSVFYHKFEGVAGNPPASTDETGKLMTIDSLAVLDVNPAVGQTCLSIPTDSTRLVRTTDSHSDLAMGSGNFHLKAWINVNQVSTRSDVAFILVTDSIFTAPTKAAIILAVKRITATTYQITGRITVNGLQPSDSEVETFSQTFTQGAEWKKVVFSRTLNTYSLYVDGHLEDSDTFEITKPPTIDSYLTVNCYLDGGARFDELSFYPYAY